MIKVQLDGLRTDPYAVPVTGKYQGLRPGDMRFAYIAKQETVSQVKEYARTNKISIKDAMELIVTRGMEALNND